MAVKEGKKGLAEFPEIFRITDINGRINVYERFSARQYYPGRRAAGSVLLANGSVLIRTSLREMTEFLKRMWECAAFRGSRIEKKTESGRWRTVLPIDRKAPNGKP